MKKVSKESLPLWAPETKLLLSQERADQFHKAFRDPQSYWLPTFTASAMKGLFFLLDQLEIDYKDLLHISQTYEYFKAFDLPQDVVVKAKLADCRFRMGHYWLTVETSIYREAELEPLVTCQSLLTVKGQE